MIMCQNTGDQFGGLDIFDSDHCFLLILFIMKEKWMRDIPAAILSWFFLFCERQSPLLPPMQRLLS